MKFTIAQYVFVVDSCTEYFQSKMKNTEIMGEVVHISKQSIT